MIPEVNPYNNYRGDGVATLFDYDFFIQNGSQLIVEHIDENDVVTRLEENIDYEIVVIEEEFAGYIRFPIEDSKFGILQENETLSLQLTLPFEQISEYGQSSLLDLNSIEFSLDYLTRLCQILKRQMERSVKVNEGSEANPTELLETINNNAIVSTNAAALASKKADEALESANVASDKVEEIDGKIIGFNESFEEMVDEIENTTETGKQELNKIKEEAQNFKEELIQGGMFKFQLFDTKTTDRILSYEETFGWALQGTYVYSTAVAGERYGYPDFIQRCIKEKSEATATSVTLGSNTLTIYKHSNGHQFYNIADKSKVDAFYNAYGVADYYGIDEANNSVFLPRNKWFIQLTDNKANVNKFTDAGLPNITGSFGNDTSGDTFNGAFYTTTVSGQNHTDTQNTSTGVGFDASRSSSVYGKSSTVQPRSSTKLLYYCVGNTKSDTSWVDVVSQVQGGVKDLEDKKKTCINEIEATGNSYDNLTHRNITNCWTKIPQRIKYTLTDGALTVLAGSVAIFPYGTENKTEQLPVGSTFLNENYKVVDTYWDGSKFFVWAELQIDASRKSTYNTLDFLYLDRNGSNLRTPTNTACSGSTADTTLGTYIFWYDTTNNYVKFSVDNGVTWNTNNSLPLVIAQGNSTAGYASIQHTFNGWGVIGHHVWWEQSEGLISDGYNKDGTYNNLKLNVPQKICLRGLTDGGTLGREVLIVPSGNSATEPIHNRCFSQEEEPNITGTSSNNWYNPKTNKSYSFNGTYWAERPTLKLLTYYGDGTNITSVTDTPQTFRPINYKSDHIPQADGKWVSKRISNTLQTAIGTQKFDLTDYLPKDNYDYEVMLNVHIYRSSGATDSSVYITTDVLQRIFMCGARADSLHSHNTVSLPVGVGRYIDVIKEKAALSAGELAFYGYRRLGKNN